MWPQEHVGCVPEYEGEGAEEPEEEGCAGGVGPAAFAGGARGATAAGESFGGGEVRGWEGGGVVAR